MAAEQTYVTLSSGSQCPQFGLGTYNPGGSGMDSAVAHAIGAGYRHIDGAHFYANEGEVGEGIRKGCKENNVDRYQKLIIFDDSLID